MDKKVKIFLRMSVILLCFASISNAAHIKKSSPDEVLLMLKEGNRRFVNGKSIHPNTDFGRFRQAGTESQSKYAQATVVACSDSRVPVERIFDAGIMDIFVIRVAGNVCGTNEAGSIEYGLAHVQTPVLVMLGHTQCGAVTAVTNILQGEDNHLERNIQHLVSGIKPAVKRAMLRHPEKHGDSLIYYGIEENIKESIKTLLMGSAATREMVKNGSAKIVGAVYDVSTGHVRWMPESIVSLILDRVEASPDKAVFAIAGAKETNSSKQTHTVHAEKKKQHKREKKIPTPIKKISLVDRKKLSELNKKRYREIYEDRVELPMNVSTLSRTAKVIIPIWLFFVLGGIGLRSSFVDNMSVRMRLYTGSGFTVITTALLLFVAYNLISQVGHKAKLDLISSKLEILSGEMERLQINFVLYGIEKNDSGKKIIEEHKRISREYIRDVKSLHSLKLDSVEEEVVSKINTSMAEYKKTFNNLANEYYKVEELKKNLGELGIKIDERLKRLVERHEEIFVELYYYKEINRKDLLIYTRLVEELVKAEMISFKVSREESEFLVDKSINRVEALEEELGALYVTLDNIESLINKSKIPETVKKNEIRVIESIKAFSKEYAENLSLIIIDELEIEAGLVDCHENLRVVKANFAAMGKRSEHISEVVRGEYNTAFIVLVLIYITGGAYLALFQSNGIIKPLKEADNMLESICRGDFSKRLDIHRGDEIGRLSDLLNSLAVKLSESQQKFDK